MLNLYVANSQEYTCIQLNTETISMLFHVNTPKRKKNMKIKFCILLSCSHLIDSVLPLLLLG